MGRNEFHHHRPLNNIKKEIESLEKKKTQWLDWAPAAAFKSRGIQSEPNIAHLGRSMEAADRGDIYRRHNQIQLQ